MVGAGALRDPNGRQRLRTKFEPKPRARQEPDIVRQFARIANDVPAEPAPDPVTHPQEDPLLKRLLGGTLESPYSDAEFAEAGRNAYRATRTRWFKQIETIVESWGEAARAYVLEPKRCAARDGECIVFEKINERYSLAIGIRDLLHAIAAQNPPNPPANAHDRIYHLPYSIELVSTLSLRMAKSNESESAVKRRPRCAVLEPPEPLKKFLEEVELDRIKRCAYKECRRIFWAGRIDRPCCSEVCRNAYRQQKHRDDKKKNRPYKKWLLKKGVPRNE